MIALGPRTAIVVIDMIGDMFAREELAAERAGLVAAIRTLTAAGRGAGSPVLWVRQEYADDLSDAPLFHRRNAARSTIAGTDGARLLPELDVSRADPVFVKKRYSGFFGTGLEAHLQRGELNALVLAGVNTHACVRMTAIDAYQRDYEVAIPVECVASYDREHHDASLRYMNGRVAEVVPLKELIAGPR